ncbi:MAG: hypothetical protein Q4P66_00730 [Actinomycetaceae bacterium]|nr:hypothetical protein [Actinomycetaceae bacterium]
MMLRVEEYVVHLMFFLETMVSLQLESTAMFILRPCLNGRLIDHCMILQSISIIS